ncbi:MAG: HNH endonuclease [Dehalococcoidales bacterium]|nr:HNH endonuclease [Dehalococcoidales bacterium]
MTLPLKYKWDDLEELYVNQKLSALKIAAIKHCPKRSVYDYLKRAGINTRSASEAQKLAKHKQLHDWSDLEELYIKQNMTATEIGEIKGCCPSGVHSRLVKMKIPLKSRSESANISFSRGRRKNPLKGRRSNSWKGGRVVTKTGYVLLWKPGHPNANARGYIPEHRYIMSEMIGRPLLQSEHVHHKNKDRGDNKRANLELLSPENHQLREQVCQHCHLVKEIRVLHAEIKQLRLDLQCKMKLNMDCN